MSDYTIVLPVLEKTCANCSAAVEGSIRKEQGLRVCRLICPLKKTW